MPLSEVYNIDCMEYMATVPDGYFDIAIVDPPYGLDKKSTQGSGKLKGRALNRGNIAAWDVAPSAEYFDELRRVSKHQVIWGGNYFPLPPTRCVVVWDKQQVWPNFSQCEIAWTSYDKPAKLVTIPNRGGHRDEQKFHPTQKPIELYAYILSTFGSGGGGKILDTHLGSGSSRIAAYKMGYDFVGCEINAEYFRLADERFKRECLGETKLSNGQTVTQYALF